MGIESQFDNRFGYLSPGEGDKLNERELFNVAGSLVYRGALSIYAAQKLNEFVEQMRAMGPEHSAKYCEHKLHGIHEEWRISKTHGDLDKSLCELAAYIKEDLIKVAEGTFMRFGDTSEQREMAAVWSLDNITTGHNRELGMVIQMNNALKMIEVWLPPKVSKSELGKLLYSKTELLKLIHEGKAKFGEKTRITTEQGEKVRKRGPVIVRALQADKDWA